ncbi:hypothetical protein BDN70DRAFT_876934 [Pholiota conissans]|uniref:Secreted protein n=1 Tax=Pholiota conissans TaxID=109636 RepID=A0A9P5Z4G0_9AGAR|nr:hypothetical protein BDN70DRAFT_876934 [Pholiota conissans]
MLPRLWTCFVVLFIRSLALAVPMAHDAQLTPILTTSSSPMPTFSSVRTPCHTTRFTHRPPELLTFGVHARRWLLTRRRKLEFFVHWVVGALLPEIRPTKEDFLYLRSLEDPIFMSATELPRTISTLLPMSPMTFTGRLEL